MLDIAIVGAGMMGTNHARVATSLPDCRVTWVVDPDLSRAEAVASLSGATPTTSVADVIDHVQAVILAVPTSQHVPLGLQMLTAGISCLIEKPIAADVQSADLLIEAAGRSGAVLAIGHVERHNPAVLELSNILDDLIHVEAMRVSAYSPRVADDVVLDLMIHDLDLVAALVGDAPTTVHAIGQKVRSGSHDMATALLEFPAGQTATVTASRLGQQKIRQLTITRLESFVTVDLVVPSVTITRVDQSEFVDHRGTRYRQSGVVEIPYLEHRGEPLALELEDFINAVRHNKTPLVSGSDGRRALLMAHQVLEALAD
jgi:predicted dehydrogenase